MVKGKNDHFLSSSIPNLFPKVLSVSQACLEFRINLFLTIKARLHILFTHAFSALWGILDVITMVDQTKINTPKMHPCINRMWQRSLNIERR